MTQIQAANKFLQCEGIQHEAWAPFAEGQNDIYKKVSFTNRYGIRLVGDLYMHKNRAGKLPAIAVCGPYGAVKEQASELYAQTLAEHGFITLAFDPSFSGESGGQPRYISSGEIYTEDYSAAVDFFMLQPEVDRERIGILGSGGVPANLPDDASGVTGGFRQIERRQQGAADYSRCKSYRLV